MIARLAANGIAPVAAGGSFVVVDVGDAARFAAGMLARGVRVRDCTSFGLPAYVRLGVRGEDEVSRLVAAWQTVTP